MTAEGEKNQGKSTRQVIAQKGKVIKQTDAVTITAVNPADLEGTAWMEAFRTGKPVLRNFQAPEEKPGENAA